MTDLPNLDAAATGLFDDANSWLAIEEQHPGITPDEVLKALAEPTGAEKKALRILSDGRLTILQAGGPNILASCKGFTDGEVYMLGYRTDQKRWGCTCEASAKFNRACSHLLALQRVTVKPKENDA